MRFCFWIQIIVQKSSTVANRQIRCAIRTFSFRIVACDFVVGTSIRTCKLGLLRLMSVSACSYSNRLVSGMRECRFCILPSASLESPPSSVSRSWAIRAFLGGTRAMVTAHAAMPENKYWLIFRITGKDATREIRPQFKRIQQFVSELCFPVNECIKSFIRCSLEAIRLRNINVYLLNFSNSKRNEPKIWFIAAKLFLI